MSNHDLKTGWTRVKFGDVVRLNTERCADPKAAGIERYVGLEHIDPEDLRIRRWGQVSEGITFTNLFRPGQVLFGKRRAYQRKVAVSDFGGVCSGDIYVFESKDSNRLLPDLLPFICQTEGFFEHAVGTSAGSLSPRTNWTQLAQFEFALPQLDEQRRLVEIFELTCKQTDSLIEALAKQYACEAALLDHFVLRLRDTCKSVSMDTFLDGSPDSGSSIPPRDTPTGHWVLALNALSRFGYKEGVVKPVDKTAEMGTTILKTGDFLISRSNTRERVGYVGIYTGDLFGNVSFPDLMMRLNLRPGILNEFLELVLQSSPYRRQIMSMAAGTSGSMKKINRRHLSLLHIPVPNQDEQIQAAEARREIRNAGRLLGHRLKSAKTLHSQLLTHLLVDH